MLKLITVSFAAVVATAGCGVETDTLSLQEAQIALNSTSAALGVATDSEGLGQCSEGGSVAATSRITDDDVTLEVSLDVEFNDCGEGGVVINGDLETKTIVREDFVSVTTRGIVSYEGEIEGTCRWDIFVEVDGNTTTVEGEFCGQSASLVMTTP